MNESNLTFLYSFRSFKQFSDCEIIAIPAKYDFKPYAYGFQKDSPYLPLFNYYLKEMREKGSLKQILEKYESPPQICPDYSGKPLNFGAVFTAFSILIAGGTLAAILFAVETLTEIFRFKMPLLTFYESKQAVQLNEKKLIKIILNQEDVIAGLESKIRKYKMNHA